MSASILAARLRSWRRRRTGPTLAASIAGVDSVITPTSWHAAKLTVSEIRGRAVKGAEAELMEAAGVDGIPIKLWDTREVLEARAQRQNGVEHRVLTPAPGTVGINMDPIQPAVFAPSIAPMLNIEMPRVASGTFATGTIQPKRYRGCRRQVRRRAPDGRVAPR